MGVHVEALPCECEEALSVHMEVGKYPTERKVRFLKIFEKVLRRHCRLSGISLLANAKLLPAKAL